MINFVKKHLKLSIFILYFSLGIIIILPAIFLINQNLALNLDVFSFNAKYFEVIKVFQNLNSQTIITAVYDILSPSAIGYLFHLIFSEPLGFNLFLILFFPFGAFGGYLLIDYLMHQESKLSAIFGGILFGLASIVCYPLILVLFFIYFLLKSLEKSSIKFGLLACLFYLFICSYNLFFSIAALLLSFIVIIFVLYPKFKDFIHQSKELTKLISFILLLIIVFSLKCYWPLRQIQSFDLDGQLFISNSLDLSKLLDFTQSALFKFSPVICLSVIFIFLLLIFIVFAFRSYQKNKYIIFSFILSIIFIIFSFGPYLIFQQNIISPKISLPYLFLYRFFPYFNQTIDPKSFLIFSLLFFIIFISFGFKFFLEKINYSPKIKTLILGAFFLLILFSSWLIWQPGPTTSSFYANLKSDENIAYLNVPLQEPGNFLYQNYENKSKIISNQKLFFDNLNQSNKKTPVSAFIDNLPQGREINYANFIQPDYTKTFTDYLANEKIKYIVFDSQFIQKTIPQKFQVSENNWEEKNFKNLFSFQKTIKFLKENTQGNWQTIGDELVYEITGQKNDQVTIYQGQNWGQDDFDQSILINEKRKQILQEHWMLNNSTLVLDNPSNDNKNIELYLNAKANNEPRKLEIYLNNTKITDLTIVNQPKAYLIDLKNIRPGQSTISFKVKDFEGQNINIAEGNKTESVLFYAIKYKKIYDDNFLPNFYNSLDSDSKILMLPAEIDSLKDNSQFIFIKDLIDEENAQITNIPVLDKLFFNNLDLRQTLNIFDKDYYYSSGQDTLNRYNIRYLAINKDWLNVKDFSNLTKFIINNFDVENVPFNDNQIVVLQIKPKEVSKQLLLGFTGNWGINEWEKQTDRFFNVAYNNARITINNQEESNVNAILSFKVENFDNRSRTIKLFLNEDWLDEAELKEIDIPIMKVGQEQNITIDLPNLKPQENEILLKIYDDNNNEIIINNNNGIRLSNFKVERNDLPINKTDFENRDYCSDNFRQIFEKYNFSKEFFDSFEDENYSRDKLINRPWELLFNQEDSFYGKQSLKFLSQQGKISKDIYGCFNEVDFTIMTKTSKWQNGPKLNISLIDSNNNIVNKITITNPKSMIVFRDSQNNQSRYPSKFNLNQWNELKINKDKDKVEFWQNNNLIFQQRDSNNVYIQSIEISLEDGNDDNIDLSFDNFKLNVK